MANDHFTGKKFARVASRLPALLVLSEKHQTVYFHIPDPEALKAVSLKVVEARMKAGWYRKPPEMPPRPDVGDPKALPRDLILPAETRLATWDRECFRVKAERDKWEEINRALAERDGVQAWMVLSDRDDDAVLESYCTDYIP